jgi:RNA methyltransferase, TrmH family
MPCLLLIACYNNKVPNRKVSTNKLPKRIDSADNPTIKALTKLKELKGRRQEGRYLIEGSRETLRALQGGERLQTLLFSPDLLNEEGEEVLVRCRESAVEMLELSQRAFAKLTLRQNPDGIIAVATIHEKNLADIILKPNALVLVIDGLEKPGNVGALLRTADAANADAVFVTGFGTDLYNPNVIRSSMGSLFSRPVMSLEACEVIEYLRAKQFKIVAATPHSSQPYWDENFTRPTAIILGEEHAGLSEEWLGAATTQVTIPMNGLADSLNVATAGALLLYEVVRQRRG